MGSIFHKKILSSDSTLPEEENIEGEDIIRIPICKVCKQGFTDGRVICDNCKHYCHEEHSGKYQMKVYDHLCLAEVIGVDKLGFKILYGLAHGHTDTAIRKAAKLKSMEYVELKDALKEKGFLRDRLFFFSETTYKAQEYLPVLESVYGKEPDVESFIAELGGNPVSAKTSSLSTSRSGIASRLKFAIASFVVVAVMMFIGLVLDTILRPLYPLPIVSWIVILLVTAYFIVKVWGFFRW